VDERLRTGVSGLDEVLAGGLPQNAINLIAGLPGTGKTLLAQQCVFANATVERPGVYVSTVSEPFEKIVRYGQTLGFFDTAAVGQRVFYEDIGGELLKEGLGAVLDRIGAILNKYEPGLLVIDSFKPFAVLVESRSEHRRFLHELAARLSVRPIASLWLGEYAVGELASAPEFAVADAVLWLASGRYDERDVRLLQVLKLRGSGFRSGRHAYRLSSEGMRVFPRLADPAHETDYGLDDGQVSSGVQALDGLLGEGVRAGSSTLVIGPSGVGKTVLGLHFAFEGARRGDGTVFATFDENPSQLARAAAGFGLSFESSELRVMYRSAVDLYLDQWVYELLDLIEAHDIRRVFIDGVSNLRVAAQEPVRFREYVYSLVQRCSRQGVSLMLALESPELFGLSRFTDVALSQMADNVVLLQFVRRDSEYKRGIIVLKSRSVNTEPRMKQYKIGSGGLELVGRERARRAP
jgi:circadian clock protein KaiC